MKFRVKIPPTYEQGGFTFTTVETDSESRHEAALWDYNKAREHDGLPPVRRLPAGTTFERIGASPRTNTVALPAAWASYLVNGDASGLDAAEKAEADETVSQLGIAHHDFHDVGAVYIGKFGGMQREMTDYVFLRKGLITRTNPVAGAMCNPRDYATRGQLEQHEGHTLVRRNPSDDEGYVKVRFVNPTTGGATAGIVLPASRFKVLSVSELSRIFPNSEARHMRKVEVSPAYPSFDSAFLHDFGPVRASRHHAVRRNPMGSGVKPERYIPFELD